MPLKHVASAAWLSKRIRSAWEASRPKEPPVAEAPTKEDPSQKPVAIVAVHGVSPIQRYAFQDQVAIGLKSYLNSIHTADGTEREWVSTVYWPKTNKQEGDPVLKPSALRLHRRNEDPHAPVSRVYDVYEGYWSPYSKGKTTASSVLGWLLQCTFLGTSSTACIPSTGKKIAWDLAYVFGGLKVALLLFIAALLLGAAFCGEYSALWGNAAAPPLWKFVIAPWSGVGAFWDLVTNPRKADDFSILAYWQLFVGIVITYLLIQLLVMLEVWRETATRTAGLRDDTVIAKGQHFKKATVAAGTFRKWTIGGCALLLILVVCADAWMLERLVPGRVESVIFTGVLLVAAAGSMRGALAIASFLLDDVLGDVQIYTTHDENSSFYAIRQAIIAAVKAAVLGPLRAVCSTQNGSCEPLYEKIHVVGHSLGSTIGLDVLMQLRQLVEEGAVDARMWSCIRSFITFGTALEKTRFFFDVRKPTVSTAQQQWENDVYGRFFTDRVEALDEGDNAGGIYWLNLWYFRDIVANAIVSYESDVTPGKEAHFAWIQSAKSRSICENRELQNSRNPIAFVHGDYIVDPCFWKEVGPVLTH